MSNSQSAFRVVQNDEPQMERESSPSDPPSSQCVRRNAPRSADIDELEVLVGRKDETAPHSSLSPHSAAVRIVAALVARGVTTYFGIPGGPICPLFEALRLNDAVELVESRHEAHAAFAAAAYYHSTGRPAAVVVTAGPGLTNAVTGVASAYTEGVPMLIISGDVAWATHGGRLAQNSGPEGIDSEQLLSPITQAQTRVTNGRSAVSQVMAALDACLDPINPGPALVVLPIDRATEEAPLIEISEALARATIAPRPETVEFTARCLAEAKRPLLVLGAGCLRQAEWVRQLVDVLDVPFVTTPRAKGVVSEEHPRSLRTGGMAASLWARKYTASGVDVALVLGSDLDDTSVGPTPYIGLGGRLIHVDINPNVFNRNLPTQLGVTADLGHFCKELYELVAAEGHRNGGGRALMKEVREESPFDVAGFESHTDFRIAPHRALADLQAAAGKNARFTSDIGEHMLFALHYLTARGPQDFHIQLNLGSMGSGIAGATGLALADRTRPVVCVCGDGGMQMSGMEILTALKLRLPIVYAVFNDSRYNMVHHGMKQIFGEAADFESPLVDFTSWARSMGVPAQTVRLAGEIDEHMLCRLLSDGGPALLDIRINRQTRMKAGGRVDALQHMSLLEDSAMGKNLS